MIPNLDVDLLKTFISIAEQGSFTRAAEEVHKTQSAVSMQMKRLEDLLTRQLFVRNGRQNRLTADGERLLDYARRMVRLNDEAVTAFSRPELTGIVRLGTPDDYADRILPEVLARFSRTHPLVQVDVECLPSQILIARTRARDLDLSVVSCSVGSTEAAIIRQEPLIWVTSLRHSTHEQDTLPLALSQVGCDWRNMVINALEAMGRRYRIAYASSNSNAVNAAVLSGLAVGAIPRVTVRPGMRELLPEEGFPVLGEFSIGMVRAEENPSSAVDALAKHIADSMGSCTFAPQMIAAE